MTGGKKILIVDDDPRVVRTLSRYLASEGFTTDSALTCAQAMEKLAADGIDLVLLDVILPDGDGKSLLVDIRKATSLPVIMLTGRDEQIDKIMGLEMGADDYITKPFDDRELAARIRSVLRRHSEKQPANDTARSGNGNFTTYRFGNWDFDPNVHEIVSDDGSTLTLTSYESRLLEYLISHAPRTVSRDQILDEIAGRTSTPFDRSVDVLIAKIRKKIEPDPDKPHFIITVRGAGYRFAPDRASA